MTTPPEPPSRGTAWSWDNQTKSDSSGRLLRGDLPKLDLRRLRELAPLILGAAALIVMVLLAYAPAMHGGMLWDDAAHLIPIDLQSLDGLRRIWFHPGATQQYYPITYTAFWLEHALWGDPTRLWGDDTFWYHMVNVIQHASAAMLVWAILHRLRIPGAWLAAAIFAVHPVQVESVAWMSEQKNTLSAACYLGSLWCYLRFDEGRERKWYLLSGALFVVGLLAKSVIATLPGALLVIFWWQRGRVSYRLDIRPLLPFFGVAIVAGLTTSWLEYHMVGARGMDYVLPPLSRLLLAGRATWFYAAKLVWPFGLSFYYPRWTLDPTVASQWLFPLAVIVVLMLLWALRTRSRSVLAGVLFFVGTLVPALGFINIYPFRFSFVADHFQYLASLGLIVLLAGGIGTWHQRATVPVRRAIAVASGLLVVGLGVLSWNQSHVYGDDAETLYRATLEQNPTSWIAHENLAAALVADGDPAGAIAEADEALRYRPRYAWAISTQARALLVMGKREEARHRFEDALAIDSVMPQVRFELANLLYQMGKVAEAARDFERTIALQPGLAQAHFNLAAVLVETGDTVRALREFDEAGRLEPASAEMQSRLAQAYGVLGQQARAAAAGERVRVIQPNQ